MGNFPDILNDGRKGRLLGPIAIMTLAGLCLLVLLALFLMMRFDHVAVDRERSMVENGIHRELEEYDAVIVPQVNWDDAVLSLDHKFDPKWADFNLGSYLYTFNGFTRSFVIDSADRPIYASVKGERATAAAYADFAPIVASVMPRIRAGEAARAPIRPTPDGDTIVTQPIQANAFGWVNGRLFVVIATLVQPDMGKILPKGDHAPVAIVAMPVDEKLLGSFASRYMVDDLKLITASQAGMFTTSAPLRATDGHTLALLSWTPRRPGLLLLRQLWLPAALSIALLSFLALVVMRGAGAIFSELVASEARARHLAFHDPLTRLPNRAMLFARLRPLLTAIEVGGPSLAVLCVDLDRFKDVNDTLGHHAGDILIETVANRLREVCAESALIARLGGDEFVVLCEGADRPAARELAERILVAVRSPVNSEYGVLEVGCSVGVAIIDRPGVDPSEALRWADLALYRSKETGRTRMTFFEDEMDAALRTRRSLERDLREALSDGSLRMAYQPQVDREGEIVAVEALLRWQHPVRGNVPPGVFVPLAEESGLILALGEFVLRQVFAETGHWSTVRTAINVSAVQLRSPGFASLVMRLIAHAGIDPSRYEIELTETALLGEDPTTAGNIEALKRLGFSIALDDFGTGYSSLSVLQRFSVDKIKIDRSFVAALGGADESEALVDAMVKLARALKVDVIAEGVESERQRERLLSCGCREFQGHLVGMPMDIASIGELVGEFVPDVTEQIRLPA